MKILHCADLHLDSRMESNLDSERARTRRGELLEAWERMVDYASAQGIRVILIAGDMFDRPRIRRSVATRVLDTIQSHPQMDFLYLRGNHDMQVTAIGSGREDLPENLKTFTEDQWTSYEYENVVITGREMTTENVADLVPSLSLDQDRFNIVMLHGQIAAHLGKNTAPLLPLEDLKGHGIDYLALGHIHSYQEGEMDDRGTWCYPGCLEGRGFDECGPKGFVMLDIIDGKMTREFVPFASRQLHDIPVTLDANDTMLSIIGKTDEATAEIDQRDLVRISLEGAISMDVDMDVPRITHHLEEKFFFAKVDDRTTTAVDYDSYLNDRTLRGEFVRLMREADLDERTRSAVTRIGVRALEGEDPEE